MPSAPGTPHLVVEVGGTTLRAAVFDPVSRQIGRTRRLPAPNYLTHPRQAIQPALLAAMGRVGHDVLEGQPPQVVSVAYPGPVSTDGVALAAPTLLGQLAEPFPLKAACQALWPEAWVTVVNDVTAAGYRYVDAGRGDFCVVTVGSGIGHKVFLAGRPVVGVAARGGEIGHLQVDPSPEALPCDCGGRGHLGGVASGRGVLRALRREARHDPAAFARSVLGHRGTAPAELTNVDLVTAFKAGDPFVRAVVATATSYLGGALAAAHLLVGLEDFVLVGGFALAMGDDYRLLVARGAADSTWDLGQVWENMVVLGHADDASGLLGAGLAAMVVGR